MLTKARIWRVFDFNDREYNRMFVSRTKTYFIRYMVILQFVLLAGLIPRIAVADDQSLVSADSLVTAGSSWMNQRGSVATLSFAPAPGQPSAYNVTGHYVNNAQGYQCQGTAYPLSGVYSSATQTISFSVVWSNASANCQSVTGWTGYFDFNAGSRIITDWNLAFMKSGNSQITQGSDIFTLSNTVTSENLLGE